MSHSLDRLAISDSRGAPVGTAIMLAENVYELGNDPARVGDPNFILLRGTGVARRHARLERDKRRPIWRVEAMPGETIQVGDITLAPGGEFELHGGRDLWIGNSQVTLTYGSKARLAEPLANDLAVVEREMNKLLLDYEERERDLFRAPGADRLRLLSEQLDRAIDGELSVASGAAVSLFCREAFRRMLISRCLMSGQAGDVRWRYSVLNEDQRLQSLKARQSLVIELGLAMEAATTGRDIEIILAKLGDAWPRAEAAVPPALQRAVVKSTIRESVLGLIFDLGPIQFLLEAPLINEIMVCGHEKIFVEKEGMVFRTGLAFTSEDELVTIARSIVFKDGKHLTMGAPMVDARLPDGSRANIVLSPTARPGTSITIRKFATKPFKIDDLRRRGMMNGAMTQFLRACVKGEKNLLISGGTGTGKTTLLNALADFIPTTDRVVTIEDTIELRLGNKNLVNLEAKRPNMDGDGEITIRDLVRNALRMRPDRIVVGECRGGETLDMLQAMNTGHEGSMTTAHANSPRDLLLRLETMVLQAGEKMPVSAIRQQISAAIDVVVQIGRIRIDPDPTGRDDAHSEDRDADDEYDLTDGGSGEKVSFKRVILEIAEVGEYDADTGEIAVHPIFEHVASAESDRFQVSGHIPTFFRELAAKGLLDIDSLFAADEEAAHAV